MSMSAGNVNLISGRTMAIEVVSRVGHTKAQLTAERSLQEIVSLTMILKGVDKVFHAEYTGQLRSKLIPLPSMARVFVTLVDRQQNPFRMTLRVKIWPSNRTLVLWWLFVLLGIMGVRWQKTLSSERSARDMIRSLLSDLPHTLELLIIGVAAIVVLRLAGWFVTLGDGPETD